MVISIAPDLQKALADYAAIYQQTYGKVQSIADLTPHMLVAFPASDAAFPRLVGAYGVAEMTGSDKKQPPERFLRLAEV